MDTEEKIKNNRLILHDLVNELAISQGLMHILLKVEKGLKAMPHEEKLIRMEKISRSLESAIDQSAKLKLSIVND